MDTGTCSSAAWTACTGTESAANRNAIARNPGNTAKPLLGGVRVGGLLLRGRVGERAQPPGEADVRWRLRVLADRTKPAAFRELELPPGPINAHWAPLSVC